MKFFYKTLGIFAGVNEFLSRKSINFVQLNWLLTAGLIFGLFSAVSTMNHNLTVKNEVVKSDPKDLQKNYQEKSLYVSLEGTLVKSLPIEYGTKHKKTDKFTVTDLYFPLVDKDLKKGVFILYPKDTDRKDSPGLTSVKGKLVPSNSAVQKEIIAYNEDITKNAGNAGLEFYTDFILEQNVLPDQVSHTADGIIVGILFILSFGLLYTWVKRYNIVQTVKKNPAVSGVSRKQLEAFEGTASDTALRNFIDGEFSGKLTFEKGGDRNFNFIPARFNFMEDSSVLIASNIDASSTFMGFTTSDRNGIWTKIFTKADLSSWNYAVQYFGTKTKPAVLLKFNNGPDAVLSFDSEKDQEEFGAKIS